MRINAAVIIWKTPLKSNGRQGTIIKMVISLLGSSGVKCQVADFSLLVDPPKNKKGGLILRTEHLIGDSTPEDNELDSPGEYEMDGIRVRGVSIGGEGTKERIVYSALFDGIRLGFLNSVDKSVPQDALDAMGEIDILFINIEQSNLNGKEMTSFVKKIDPKILIPTTDKGAKILLEEFGQKGKAEDKFTIKAKDINEEEGLKVIWLKA
jgi:hypothetical protein